MPTQNYYKAQTKTATKAVPRVVAYNPFKAGMGTPPPPPKYPTYSPSGRPMAPVQTPLFAPSNKPYSPSGRPMQPISKASEVKPLPAPTSYSNPLARYYPAANPMQQYYPSANPLEKYYPKSNPLEQYYYKMLSSKGMAKGLNMTKAPPEKGMPKYYPKEMPKLFPYLDMPTYSDGGYEYPTEAAYDYGGGGYSAGYLPSWMTNLFSLNANR
jgi:hypothetical protein